MGQQDAQLSDAPRQARDDVRAQLATAQFAKEQQFLRMFTELQQEHTVKQQEHRRMFEELQQELQQKQQAAQQGAPDGCGPGEARVSEKPGTSTPDDAKRLRDPIHFECEQSHRATTWDLVTRPAASLELGDFVYQV